MHAICCEVQRWKTEVPPCAAFPLRKLNGSRTMFECASNFSSRLNLDGSPDSRRFSNAARRLLRSAALGGRQRSYHVLHFRWENSTVQKDVNALSLPLESFLDDGTPLLFESFHDRRNSVRTSAAISPPPTGLSFRTSLSTQLLHRLGP
jgi:hypothetical protein